MTDVKEFKAYMRSINVSDCFTDYLLDMLEGESDLQSLVIKIEILHSEGIDIASLEDSIMEDPWFVVEEPKVIADNIDVLKKYLDKKELNKVLEMNPEYLTVQGNSLEQNIKMIKLLVSPKCFEVLFKAHGEIFTFNSDFLEKRFEFFIKNGLKDKIEELILTKMEVFDLEEEEINLDELR